MTFAKRSLGQNFLVDPTVATRILDGAVLGPGDAVVEIGPGRGALTALLATRVRRVVAIEKDDALAAALAERFGGDPRVEVRHQDALEFDWHTLQGDAPWKVVANLPYNVATPIALDLVRRHGLFSDLVLMFQREVALRFAAAPGTRDYGIPTVLARVHADAWPLFTVPPGAFRPVPRVVSSVVRFRVLAAPRVPAEEWSAFEPTVRASFHARRKTLLNSLLASPEFGAVPAAALRDACAAAGVDPSRRGETLDWREFRLLAPALATAAGPPG